MENEGETPYRPVEETAMALARRLMTEASHAVLATSDLQEGWPGTSLLAMAVITGQPVSLVSSLAEHARALDANPRVSLLFGTPGKGDPLAHPRLSLRAMAHRIDRQNDRFADLRLRYLEHQPKARLYIDFPDFYFIAFAPRSALLNAGFGKAYRFEGSEIEAALK